MSIINNQKLRFIVSSARSFRMHNPPAINRVTVHPSDGRRMTMGYKMTIDKPILQTEPNACFYTTVCRKPDLGLNTRSDVRSR